MMSSIDSRAPFFPHSRTSSKSVPSSRKSSIQRNTYERMQELDKLAAKDARVSIPDTVKDFSQIKREVDMAPNRDNTDKIARLKAQIQSGTYEPDYDAIADKMLMDEY